MELRRFQAVMTMMRNAFKKIPGVRSLYGRLRDYIHSWHFRSRGPESVFQKIHNENGWSGDESVSGPGSSIKSTRVVAENLPLLLHDLKVASMLDIPCGDFHWMKGVDLSKITYIGADIVTALVEVNQKRYGGGSVSFDQINLLEDRLPKVDLIFCRDCLVHFSNQDVHAALRRIVESESGFLLTTTFPDRDENIDIFTGQWRPLNLQAEPFGFPAPMRMINEHCTEGGGRFLDKSIALWKISEIKRLYAS